MRKTLAVLAYLGLVDYLAVCLIWSPSEAFIQSNTGWAQIASQSAISTYQAANRSSLVSNLAGSALAASSGQAIATRIVAGAAFGAVGVLAGMALYQIYYNSSDTATVKANAAPPGNYTVPNFNYPISDAGMCPSALYPCSGMGAPSGARMIHVPNEAPFQATNGCLVYSGNTQFLSLWNGSSFGPGHAVPPGYVGWSGLAGTSGCYAYTTNSSVYPVYTQPLANQQNITDYLASLPPSNALSPEAHIQPMGQGATAPTADQQTMTAVTPSQIVPTTVPAGNVGSGDAVLNPNAPPPSNTTVTNNTNQTTTNTTTATTTTNPDGSVTTTETQQETATASCTTGTHDPRTVATILTAHMQVWNSSGLVGALTSLKTLVWPSTFPTYTLTSSLFGTLTFDFSGYAWAFTALRSLLIALASFVAYRIVFVGNA